MRKYVIVHPVRGIYVGGALGLGFWSKWDAVGQDTVCAFDSEQQARKHVASWRPHDDEQRFFTYHPVITSDEYSASIPSLITGGLAEHIGFLGILETIT